MIKLFIMDVDGTLTDGFIYIGNKGEIMKSFSIKDGYGIANLIPKLNIIPIIITGRKSKILKHRCNEICIDYVYQGIKDKKKKLKEISTKFKVTYSEIAYIGDDLNDFDCMSLCGMRGCPKDAVSSIKDICNFVSEKNGGQGAIREFIEYIATKQK